MIKFNYQTPYAVKNAEKVKQWLTDSIQHLDKIEGEINYVFCTNAYILEINKNYLQHHYTTDIITFDYTEGKRLNAEIYISIDEVRENAKRFDTTLKNELHRVIIHGILHLAGFKDKTDHEQQQMRNKEDYYLSLRTF